MEAAQKLSAVTKGLLASPQTRTEPESPDLTSSISKAHTDLDEPSHTPEICEWCKKPVRMMVQKGTEICSQKCAKLAADILFDDPERAAKFGGGYADRGEDRSEGEDAGSA
jgi:hypothetical protein